MATVECAYTQSFKVPLWRLSTHDERRTFSRSRLSSDLRLPLRQFSRTVRRQRMPLKQYRKLAREYRNSDCYEIAWKWFSRNAEDNENDSSIHLLSGITDRIIRILCTSDKATMFLWMYYVGLKFQSNKFVKWWSAFNLILIRYFNVTIWPFAYLSYVYAYIMCLRYKIHIMY